MTPFLRLSQVFFILLIIVVEAAIVHVASVLMIPRFARLDAYHQLLARGRVTEMRVLDAPTLRSMVDDPAIVAAACTYDLSNGPLRVSTVPQPQEFLSVSFHQPIGNVFFAVTDKAAAKGNIDMLLVTPDQLQAIEAQDDPDEPVPELRLVAPELRGYVFVRSLVQRPLERAEAERRLMAVGCETDKSELP